MCMIVEVKDGEDMVTIKQIAQKTGYSLSTVSIVLRGIAEERGIPQSTRDIILDKAREMGYQPNVAARRLRNDELDKKNIAIFWSTDFRSALVAQFIQGIQRFITDTNSDIEAVICPYKPDKLSDAATQKILNMYAGALICTASKEDLSHIETLSTICPIVLYNRTSEKFPSVSVDNKGIGHFAAQKLIENHCRRIIIVTDRSNLIYQQERIQGFLDECVSAGLTPQILYADSPSIEEGRICAHKLSAAGEHCGVFSCSDQLAFGLMSELTVSGIRIPEDIEILTIGTSTPALYQCFSPSLAAIKVPITDMAYTCAQQLNELITSRTIQEKRITIPFSWIPGYSLSGNKQNQSQP